MLQRDPYVRPSYTSTPSIWKPMDDTTYLNMKNRIALKQSLRREDDEDRTFEREQTQRSNYNRNNPDKTPLILGGRRKTKKRRGKRTKRR